jgi:hypothetical protein
MSWEEYGRKQPWTNVEYYPNTCMKGLGKRTKKPHSWSLGSDLNPGPPEYEAGVLTTWLQHLV